MQDIDRLSKKIPVLCKVAPNSHYHMQDVNRAGGVMSIMGELAAAGLIDTTVKRIGYDSLESCLAKYNLSSKRLSQKARKFYLSAPGNKFCRELGAQGNYHNSFDDDRTQGCIRDVAHAYFTDGGLAVLTGNIARNGCIVKTAGVDESLLKFRGKARVFESQGQAMNGILNDEVKAGEVVVIRYEGPKGGPGMQEMLYPTSYLKSKQLDKVCALITDGRFSGGTSGLSVGHISPEAAAGGEIAVVQDGDTIEINIPERSINLLLSPEELSARLKACKIFKPVARDRRISKSLQAYAMLVSSADKGAIRDIY